MMPVFICSKGRAKNCSTARLLDEAGIKYFLIVEDEAEYRLHHPGAAYFTLAMLNQGITYARNSVLRLAREHFHFDWFWMLDDDISNFYLVENGKTVKSNAKLVLETAFEYLSKVPLLAVGALEYNQYAWAAKKDYAMNSYCDVAVLINVNNTRHINYRPNCKEDRDFVLQALSTGYKSARCERTAFACPKNGSNAGGLSEAYAAGLENHWSMRMVELWPGICELKTKKDGRPDVKIHWRKLFS